MQDLHDYPSRGARALVLLHERELRAFLPVWRRAAAAGIPLPVTEDPSYASLDALLRHVLRAARGYAVWICQVLELPDPGIRPTPEEDRVAAEAEEYGEHVLERWRVALAAVDDERMEGAAHTSRWGAPYTIDSMLEHAVMHPLRHAFQLEELTAARG
jgi:hypothetical protein